MRTIIIYESSHHGNTKKLVDAIAKAYDTDTVSIENAADTDLKQYDLIGLASGIAFAKFYKRMEKFAGTLPEGSRTFLLFTCGRLTDMYTKSIAAAIKNRKGTILGEYGCLGYDTYGPFRLVGGIAKGHPTDDEISGAVSFYKNLLAEK